MIELGEEPFLLDDLARCAVKQEEVLFTPTVLARIQRGRDVVESVLRSGRAAYGINTGFGALAEVRIEPEALQRLQHRLILSHAAGVGQPLSESETRALMILRCLVLATGHAGVRPLIAQQLLQLYHHDILPIVPEKGSVGASGDLAPLAHVALALIGEGDVNWQGRRMSAAAALSACGMAPLVLEAKEGLALVNGTQAMSAVGGLALAHAQRLLDWADAIGALSVEGIMGSHAPFDARIMAVRPHPGQQHVAARMRHWLEGGQMAAAHIDCSKVQDAYSFRCIPQVHGASRDAIDYAVRVLEIEFNAATDNPLVFAEQGDIVSGGNFHGQPVALALDFACIALAEIASISERRVEQLLNPALSGLPAFLSPHPGENSGFMMAQVTAASLVNENKMLCFPASCDSIPTSANREDHVSMGMTSARKLRQIAGNVRAVLAIELLCAAQALEFRRPLRPGAALARLHDAFRGVVKPLADDRLMATDIAAAEAFIESARVNQF